MVSRPTLADFKRDIESFKRDIKLPDYACSQGYFVDKKESTRSCLILRCGGDKIAVSMSRDSESHWVYYSFRDPEDNGTIIDFAMRRHNLKSMREIRLHLQKYTGQDLSGHGQVWSKPSAIPKDRNKVAEVFNRTKKAQTHPFLLSRGIHSSTLQKPRFDGRVRIDYRGNAVFPIYDHEGLCGLDKRNNGFKGCLPGGFPGVWISRYRTTDKAVVVCESAIDSLSYFQLFDDEAKVYVSTVGALTDEKMDLIGVLVRRLGDDAVIIDATDNDVPGNEYTAKLNKRFGSRVVTHKVGFKGDWNDVAMDQAHAIRAVG